ncbi:hypothetical protein SH1V18_08120 [Vallitalea longa]|uniref:Uncharacterized protein n=1 Tax=Vallitalea longa TaxID=2936439 RepID=A0A9W5Y7X1_9FIRM|nr:aminopeptidase [Vallitalea longa]GKX28332.1 hypothetical protein SH1V18_08120 [Vallitalea longa]
MVDNELRYYYDLFLESCNEKLNTAQRIRQNIGKHRTLEQNKLLFGGMGLDYAHNFANPRYLHELGFADADILSVIYYAFDRSLRNVMLNRPIFVWNKSDLLIALRKYFMDLDREKLQGEFDKQFCKTRIHIEDTLMLERSTTINCFNRVLESANPSNLDWMSGYGVYITKLEQEMCQYWYALPQVTIDKMANHIVDAFFHGFLSQSRTIGNRTNIRIMYAIGQEALAQGIVEILRRRGMEPIILMPSSIAYQGQCIMDHSYDYAIYSSLECYEAQKHAYSIAIERYHEYIKNTCGFIRVGTFGNEVEPDTLSKYAYHPSTDTLKIYNSMIAENRGIESNLLKPDTLSFCSVVFPDKRVGYDFQEIFDGFSKLNTEESEPYELIQEKLIGILDKCDRVHLVGMNGNVTDLNVSMSQLKNKGTQTKFLNCGGDINVPHGEMFTTPILAETNGVLNVKEIFLKNKYYKNLRLTFRDGLVTDYDCDNFSDEEENRQYIFENLLNSTENVPIGELSIGTNTLAYRMALDFNLFSRLPILLAEKMGPHIAVGDPCFARGEDSPVYNIYSGKEMIARENEITMKRKENPDCYMNFHTDITIPFNEMGLFVGTDTKLNEEHVIIRDGRFVPSVANKLNKNLE